MTNTINYYIIINDWEIIDSDKINKWEVSITLGVDEFDFI